MSSRNTIDRPIVARPKKKADWLSQNDRKFVQLGKVRNPRDELEDSFGPLAAGVIRDTRRQIDLYKAGLMIEDPVEQELRMANYLTAATGSTEDLVTERRALAVDIPDERERLQFLDDVESTIEEKQREFMGLDGSEDSIKEPKEDERDVFGDGFEEDDDPGEAKDPDVYMSPNQLAHGEWSEMLVSVDRNIKLWRGGRLESYRALVIGGNLNGCGGFGLGKSQDPILAVDVAGRMCKRNIFFVDRYQGNGLTRDLVGKQNSCIVRLRATDNGLRGNELVREILKRFGITNCVAKSHGNRNPYNVVRATFKALMTHESIEDIALKRGKRIVSIDRAMRMQI